MPKGRKTSKHYNKLEVHTLDRLDGWKLHTLSHAGRLALTKHVLLALSVYYMGAHSLPKVVLNILESGMRRFFWGKSQQKHCLAYVSWDRICLPTEKRGLGLRSLNILNKTVIVKAFWTLATNQQSMWGDICAAKYKGVHTWWTVEPSPTNSTTFNTLL
jgi:hypothetical protein